MKTLIKGGTVVTAAEMTPADVLIEGETIRAIGTDLGEADRVIDAAGRYVMPGGIDVHTHMELPFGGTFASDDFATGTRARGVRRDDDDRGLRRAGLRRVPVTGPRHLAREGVAKEPHRLRPAPHRARDQPLDPRRDGHMIERGVTSFKLFMAYPGVFMLDDASIFRAMSKSAENGALIMLHAENGGAIDVLVQRYLAEGKTAPINHGLTRPASMEGRRRTARSRSPSSPRCPSTSCT